MEEVERCAKEVEDINVKLGGLDPTKLEAERDKLASKQEELTKQVCVDH